MYDDAWTDDAMLEDMIADDSYGTEPGDGSDAVVLACLLGVLPPLDP